MLSAVALPGGGGGGTARAEADIGGEAVGAMRLPRRANARLLWAFLSRRSLVGDPVRTVPERGRAIGQGAQATVNALMDLED